MFKGILNWILSIIVLLSFFTLQIFLGIPAQAAGATSNIHIVKYAADNVTKLAEKTVSYEWMQKMLPVQGDGKTHYYHQGPIFEGDIWDPEEMNNLKDKGAVKGTAAKDLCDLVGGMSPGDELSVVAVDKWHTEFAYSNIYGPIERQGIITLCWYNGEDAQEGELYGVGYPGNNAYHTALQLVFLSAVQNPEGKHVFGNADMKAAFPEEKYQHFYEGQYPSSNGLSGKWIAELRIYIGGIKPGLKIDYTTANYPDNNPRTSPGTTHSVPWVPVIIGVVGLLLLALAGFLIRNLGLKNLKIGAVLIAGLLLIVSSVLLGIHPWQGSLKWDVTLAGLDGKPQVLSYDKIKNLPSYTGKGGFFTTVGVVYGPYEAKGVLLSDLCQLAGGITRDDIMMISASDGYSTVFDYDQVMGNFITYDAKTMKEAPHGELKAVLMYQQDGKPLSDDDGKPLRIAIAGRDGLLTEGNNWVKWVNKIEILKVKSLTN